MPPPPTAAELIDQTYDPAVPIGQLKLHPDNPNQGDLGAVMESMAINGFGGALWVQRSSSFIIDGEHRLLAAREFGMDTVPVLWMDVDDETASRLLIATNRIARLGLDRTDVLADLLSGLAQTDDGLAGTGYDGDDLDRMLFDLATDGVMPEAKPSKEPSFNVTVACRDRDEQTEAVERLRSLGFDAKAGR